MCPTNSKQLFFIKNNCALCLSACGCFWVDAAAQISIAAQTQRRLAEGSPSVCHNNQKQDTICLRTQASTAAALARSVLRPTQSNGQQHQSV
jgi:hypothetical protein